MPERESPVAIRRELSARVVRCTCKAPQSHAGQVCPRGRVEDLGVLSYWHRNPIKRAVMRLRMRYRKWRRG